MDQVPGGIGWFEVGTADPDGAERFYGGPFGWTFDRDDGPMDYRLVTTGEGKGPSGGIHGHGGAMPNYAVFCVKVTDVAATVARAEGLGAKTLVPPTGDGSAVVFAHLADPDGNHFAIYSQPAP